FRDFRVTAFEEQTTDKGELIRALIAGGDDPESRAREVFSSLASLKYALSLYGPDNTLIHSAGEALSQPPEAVRDTALGSANPVTRSIWSGEELFHLIMPLATPDGRYLLTLSQSRSELTAELQELVSTLVLTGLGLLLATSLIVAQLVNKIRRPLQVLQTAASAYASGKLEHRFQISHPREMALLAETMNGMAEQLTSRIRAISAQRNQLEAMLAGMVEGVILVGREGRIRTINRAACELFGLKETTTKGQPLIEAIRNSELFDFYRSAAERGGTIEAGIQTYEESSRFLQAHGTLLPGEDGREDVLIVLNDITRIRRLEAIRQEFVANVSHELKTPITSILGFVETLLDGAVEEPEEARSFLNIVAGQTRRLNSIIDDLLQLARLEQSREQLPTETVAVREMVNRVLEECRWAADRKGISLEAVIGEECDTVVGSRNLLERALVNLVDNAIKYSPTATRVSVACELTTLTDGEQRFTLSVTDEGPGIPPVEQGRVFERFYRIDKARSRELGGTGLGLAIVKHVALVHGGSVDLESERGEGSRFTIHIPQGVKRPAELSLQQTKE
ncbi:MAG: ATP-binding protein, partial [Alkalispirochaetaceae bacterium]